jgi:hypothetical protein
MAWTDSPHIEHVEADSSTAVAVVDGSGSGFDSECCSNPVRSLHVVEVCVAVEVSHDAPGPDYLQRLETMKVVVEVGSLVVADCTVAVAVAVDFAVGTDSGSGVDSVDRHRVVWSKSRPAGSRMPSSR